MPASSPFDTGLSPTELDPERPRPIETPWGTMALYRLGKEVLCCQAFCPHLEGPLFQGTLTPATDGTGGTGGAGPTVTCPWHRWRYDLRTGARLEPAPGSEPPDGPLARCEVELGPQGTIRLRRAEGCRGD